MRPDLFDLTDEVAVVLGGTGVLGGAMAEALASAGARVAVVGRSAERGHECVRRIEALQAFVFGLLTAIFMNLSTASHGHDDHAEEHGEAAAAH